MNVFGIIFLTFMPLLLTDLVKLFGLILPRLSAMFRGWALIAGMVLSLVALFQGMRLPVVTEYEVRLTGLLAAMDGTVMGYASRLSAG